MTTFFGEKYQVQRTKSSQTSQAKSQLALPEVPVYIYGDVPPITELNSFLYLHGCKTSLSLLRPIRIWADLAEDIVGEADKAISYFIPEDLERPAIAIILPPFIALAAALVAQIQHKCLAQKVILIHYRTNHEPHFVGFELNC